MTTADTTPVAVDELTCWREMLRVRRFEERCAELYSGGHIRGFMHLCVGEEAVAVGVLHALGPDDAVVSTYRDHGHALVRGVSMDRVMAEMFGKVTGCSRGRGGSMHLFDAGSRFYGGNAIVGGGLPLATGLALADQMTHRTRVTCCFFGDGAMAEGEFHEAMNLAALWHLPVLFCCENNQYAMGTSLVRTHAATDLAGRASSYGMPAAAIDGMDVVAVGDAATAAVAAIRAGEGPRFLELQTYRFRAHSMFDPELYRSRSEVDEWKQRDPIDASVERLRVDGRLDDDIVATVEQEIAEEIDTAIERADEADVEPVGELLRFVTSEDPA